MASASDTLSSNLIIHPGETLAEVLADRGLTNLQLAKTTGYSLAFIDEVLSGRQNITINFARSLELTLAIPESFWLNLQYNYDQECITEA